MAFVNLKRMSKPRTVYRFRFSTLNGGLNLRDAEINLKDNESPEIVNLWWEDGLLQSRPGQELVTSGWGTGNDDDDSGEEDDSGDGRNGTFSAAETPHAATPISDGVLVHIGRALYECRTDSHKLRLIRGWRAGTGYFSDVVPNQPGTFFRFGDELFYKNYGGFYRLVYDSTYASWSLYEITDSYYKNGVQKTVFVPTILINAAPASGSGDIYQPENALSPLKRVTYNAVTTPTTVTQTANGTARFFSLGLTKANDHLQGVSSVYVNDAYIEPALYTVDVLTGSVLFSNTPQNGAVITFTVDIGNCTYQLPVERVDSVTSVIVDGIPYTEGEDYTVDVTTGTVTFTSAPPVTDPPTQNTVEITYSKRNPEALAAIMNCSCAAVYGAGQELCAVLGGNPDAPNTFYWSGSTQYGLDMTYWPVLNYNLADSDITGFGKQYDQMFVFQKDKLGKLSDSVETVNGRDTVSLAYSGVNDAIGCDLPQSVQLVENNLTFANTSGGVYQILSASAAYENNVQCISDKVNGSNIRPGLLYDLSISGSHPVRSLDDGKRYWLAVNGHVWLWDYSISGNADPVWFFFTGLAPYAFAMLDNAPCLFNADCEAVKLSGQVLTDGVIPWRTPVVDGRPFRKAYQFPVRNFGSYDCLKDVLTLLVSVRADTPSDIKVIYETDYESRADLINLTSPGYDRLSERNLEVRDLSVPRHAVTFRRQPSCRHVRHFSLRFETDADTDTGHNLAVYSVELQYRFAGRDR